MLFPTLVFALFFLVVFSLSWSLRNHPESRKWLLLAASYFFYGYWDWRFLFLLLFSSLMNYVAGVWIDAARTPQQGRRVLTVAVGLNLAVLGFFKYYNFFSESLTTLIYAVGWQRDLPFLNIILPVGISFFTFQGISYLFDVYRQEIPAARSPLDILLYISFFPQLVAGPIVRAAQFLPQLHRPPDPANIQAGLGFLLILSGLLKKVVIANYLAVELVDPVFFDPSAFGTLDLVLAVYGYAVQIYCDFSAYSDIAIGVAALLGYRFSKNFNQPYRALGIRDFWRRWHISLSTWLRDYLYIPLGGGRGGPWRRGRNLMVTMLLGGLWHGAAAKFIVWGGVHGAALMVEHRWRQRPGWGGATASWARMAMAWFLVFHFICFTWIFFRAASLETAFHYLSALTHWHTPTQAITPFLLFLTLSGLAAQFLPADSHERLGGVLQRMPWPAMGLITGLAIVVIDALGPEGVAPFIYFQF